MSKKKKILDDEDKFGPVGAESFGADSEGNPTGSEAVGGADADTPLRGALLFGNDPEGEPRGSEAFGSPDSKHPLRGALLFGNDPQGDPRGAELIGEPERDVPLKGALLFGNDPEGSPRGAEIFGVGWGKVYDLGAAAFGSMERIPARLKKDAITYDFGGVLLRKDDASLAGVRKDPRDAIRERVLRLLGRYLGCEVERLRHGLGERAIPWGRLKRERTLDFQLAQMLRHWYRRAPGEVLGLQQTQEVLETTERMHTFEMVGRGEIPPLRLDVYRDGEVVAVAKNQLHRSQRYFVFQDPDGKPVAYVDAILPRKFDQVARMMDAKGNVMATAALVFPGMQDEVPKPKPDDTARFHLELRDERGQLFAVMEEKPGAPTQSFRAALTLAESEEHAGVVREELREGKIRTHVELDLTAPRLVAWGLGAIMSDLVHLRQRGWPDVREEPEEEMPEPLDDPFDEDEP